MGVATYQNWNNGSSTTQYTLQKELLERAGAHVCLDIACDMRKVGRNTGASIGLARYDVPAVNTSPIGESLNPAERSMQAVYYHGTLERYGDIITISREQLDLHPLPTLKAAAENILELCKSTQEAIRWATARGGSTVLYNSSAITTRGTVNGVFSPGRLQKLVRGLHDAKGKVFANAITGAAKDGTRPVEPAFYAFCSTDLQSDLRANLPSFRTVSDYPTGKGISVHEFGSWQNIRFFTSQELGPIPNIGASASGTNFITSGTLIDVYPIVVVAKDALTSIDLRGEGPGGMGNVKPLILDKADKSDPTNAVAKVAISWYDLCMRTNESWIGRLETACTDNPTS